MAKKNHWVQFARNQAYKGIDPSSSESSSEMRMLLEAAGRLDGLDPKVFAGEHRNIESQPQVMRLHVFLGHRFAEGRCFGCQKELAAAMMLRRCLRPGGDRAEEEAMRSAMGRLVDAAAAHDRHSNRNVLPSSV